MAICADVNSLMQMQIFTKIWYQIFFDVHNLEQVPKLDTS